MQNSNVSDTSLRTALIALGATVFGAMVMRYAWDRYQEYETKDEEDSSSWFQKKRISGATKLRSDSSNIGIAKMTPMPEPASKPLVSDRAAASSSKISSSASSATSSSVASSAQKLEASYKTTEKVTESNFNEGKVEEHTTIRQGPVLVSGNEHHQKAETTVVAETVRREVKEAAAAEQRTVSILEAEGTVKVRERDAVIQEVVHPVEVEEIQPVIHRERKRTEVHQIIQPIYEEKMLPSQEAKRELIPEHLPTEYESREEYIRAFEENLEESSLEYAEAKKITLMKPAVVEEIIKTDIIEVIQPVIHRETIAPTVIKTTKPIFEKIKEQPTLIREVREPITLTSQELAMLKSVTQLLREEQQEMEEEEVITTKTTTVVTTEVTKDVSEKLVHSSSKAAEEVVQQQSAFSSSSVVSSK